MITWEEAVEQLRRDPAQEELVRSCYYDDPLIAAAERFAASEEWEAVLRERLEKLSCGFPLSENYFALQAFGRSYGEEETGPLPPYLKAEHFEMRADDIRIGLGPRLKPDAFRKFVARDLHAALRCSS